MLTAHDKLRISEMLGLNTITIDASMVKSTDFHLSKEQERELFNKGKDGVLGFDWDRIPPPTGVLFKDPQAVLILQETSAAINNIILNTPRVGKRCYERYEEIWTCLANGDGVNETRFRLRNVGTEPTTLIRYTIAYDEPTEISFRDCKFEKRDVQPTGCDVVILPLQNTRLVKEYALWFLPPILPGEYREVTTIINTPKIFRPAIANHSGPVSWSVEHESSMSSTTLVLRVAKNLGHGLEIPNNSAVAGTKPTIGSSATGDFYEATWKIPNGLTSKLEVNAVFALK
jgi:hypothetical protein